MSSFAQDFAAASQVFNQARERKLQAEDLKLFQSALEQQKAGGTFTGDVSKVQSQFGRKLIGELLLQRQKQAEGAQGGVLTLKEQRELALFGKRPREGQQFLTPDERTKAARIKAGLEPSAERPKPETVGQIRAEQIRRLQAIPEPQRTKAQSESLKRLLEGQAAVQINFGKPASASERTAIAETAASLDSLDNLKSLFRSRKTKTGPITGRVSPFTGLAGLTSNEQEDFMAASSAFENKVIKEITGAQMSEQEATRILRQVPRVTDPPARWLAKEKQTRQNLKRIQKRRAEVLKKSGLVSPVPDQLEVGQTVTNNGQQFTITGFDTDGTPLGEPTR